MDHRNVQEAWRQPYLAPSRPSPLLFELSYTCSIFFAIVGTKVAEKDGAEKAYDFKKECKELYKPGRNSIDHSHKDEFEFISAIRLPGFVTHGVFEWARGEASRKKKLDPSGLKRTVVDEGMCVQCMHVGPYDEEPRTIEAMLAHAESQGHKADLSGGRHHHEIYLSDPRKTAPEKLKTVIRIPVMPQ